MLAHAHHHAVDMQCASCHYVIWVARSIYLLRKCRRNVLPHSHGLDGLLRTLVGMARSTDLVQTGSGAHPGVTKSVLAFFPEVKRPGREVNPSQPCSDEVRNEMSCTSTTPIHLNRVQQESRSSKTTLQKLPFPNLF
jgi:hypothetical protein